MFLQIPQKSIIKPSIPLSKCFYWLWFSILYDLSQDKTFAKISFILKEYLHSYLNSYTAYLRILLIWFYLWMLNREWMIV